MNALSFHPADRLSDDQLAALFNRGYSGYYVPVTLDAAAFRGMVSANDIDLAASRLGERDGAPVAFAMLAMRGRRGWIGGMGVVPEARGRGDGHAIMDAVLESARARGLAAVDLEVLEQNQPAARIYEALGFRDRRWLDVWSREPAPLPPATGPLPAVVTAPAGECLARHARFHPRPAPWQRDLGSLEHWADRLEARAVRGRRGLVAWVLYRADGRRLNLADVAARGRSAPAALEATLRDVLSAHPESTLTLINLPADDPASDCLRGLGAVVRLRQREMTLAL